MPGDLAMPVFYALAAIGALVVLYVAVKLIAALAGLALLGAVGAFDRVSGFAFSRGGGRTYEHEAGERHPTAPWDRVYIEALWLKQVCGWIAFRLGLIRWRHSRPERPDIERLHELREESTDGE